MANSILPRNYFEQALPSILRWKGDAATALGVNVRFDVRGPEGGVWTVRMRPPKAGVVRGAEWKADLEIKITATELKNMLQGKFDAKAALEAGNIELAGDLGVLKKIAFLFQLGGSPAEVQLAAGGMA